MPSKKKHGHGQQQPPPAKKKTVAFSDDDEKSSLLPKQEAKSSPLHLQHPAAAGADASTATNGGTFPAAAEPQEPQYPHQRKPSISIIDGYNSPVRRGGPRTLELEEEQLGGHGDGHGHGHDHCVIALVENEQTEHLSVKASG